MAYMMSQMSKKVAHILTLMAFLALGIIAIVIGADKTKYDQDTMATTLLVIGGIVAGLSTLAFIPIFMWDTSRDDSPCRRRAASSYDDVADF